MLSAPVASTERSPDPSQIVNIHLYVPSNWENETITPGQRVDRGEHQRLSKLYREPELHVLVTSEAAAEAGRTMVAGQSASNELPS